MKHILLLILLVLVYTTAGSSQNFLYDLLSDRDYRTCTPDAAVFPVLTVAQIRAYVYGKAPAMGLDPRIIMKMIRLESGFNNSRVSPKGAVGLLQVLPSTARAFKCGDIRDPYNNLKAGMKFMSFLLRKYDGDLELALAAYNAGPGSVDRYKGVPPFKETVDYVVKIMY